MLSVVTYLRTQNVAKRGRGQVTQWDNNFWLELDYLEVASAAQRCSAYFTALLYTEIWADIERYTAVSKQTISNDVILRNATDRRQLVKKVQSVHKAQAPSLNSSVL